MPRDAREDPFDPFETSKEYTETGLKAATGVNAILFKITKISGRISLFSRPIRGDRRCISYILEWATVRGKHRPMFVRRFSLLPASQGKGREPRGENDPGKKGQTRSQRTPPPRPSTLASTYARSTQS